MRWKAKHMRRALWHRWFAWRPVAVGEYTVWLEKVSYRKTVMSRYGDYTEYKAGW